jgi:hypothetical protein
MESTIPGFGKSRQEKSLNLLTTRGIGMQARAGLILRLFLVKRLR